MDWKKHFKFHDLSVRDSCIVFLLIVFNLFILLQISFWRENPEAGFAAYRAQCGSHQRVIYRIMHEVPAGEEFELPPEWSVADLIREAVRRDRQASAPIPEKDYFCRNGRYERKFKFLNLRRRFTEVAAPYLVFPAPASAVLDGSLLEPVPILMCPPGAHGKRGSNVLYSDGSVKKLTTEEAEKLVAEQSPVPLEISFETLPEDDKESH